MKLLISVTFEYLSRPPDTFKTTISASKVHTCVQRAVKDAQKALRPQKWSTMNAVVLERLESDEAETSSEVDESEADAVEA